MPIQPPKVPFKPKWTEIKSPSENKELTGTPAQRLFSPIAGTHIQNPNSGEQEIALGGYERESASIKIYQPDEDRYSRAYIPPALLQTTDNYGHQRTTFYQGIGTTPTGLVVAGGTPFGRGSMDVINNSSKKVFTFDAATKKVEELPNMEYARSAPIAGSSPDGRFLVVAGGLQRDNNKSLGPTDHVEIYDREKGEWIDVEKTFPGLETLPEGRFGGSMVWFEDKGVKKLFFLGGSTMEDHQWRGVEESAPTQKIHVYDFNACKWSEAELPTPRMFPGVAQRALPDGTKEIVIAGGGTGTPLQGSTDPQIYSVEVLDPYNHAVSFGAHLPEQIAIKTGNTEARDWSPTALVFTAGTVKSNPCTALDTSLLGYYFGFSKAYAGAPLTSDTVVKPPIDNGTQVGQSVTTQGS